jgi:hypothetical protein
MKVRHILAAVTGVLLLTPGTASARPGGKIDGSARALASCLGAAAARHPMEWICTPAGLTTIGRKGYTSFTPIPPTIPPAWSEAGTGQDDDDGWCEGGSACRRGTTTKTTIVYGDATGPIGTFDVVRRTGTAWWRTTLIWDRGPALTFGAARISPTKWRWDSGPIYANDRSAPPSGMNAAFTPDGHGQFTTSPADSFPIPGNTHPKILIPTT